MHNIPESILKSFKDYQITRISGGASKKKFYRLKNILKSYILIDFREDKLEYNNHINIYSILKDINISIPVIIKKFESYNIIITQDLGDLRFDKILNDNNLNHLLKCAVETLIVLKKSIKFNKNFKMPKYNYAIFEKEIFELPKYYLPSIGINNSDISKEFIYYWHEEFSKIRFDFNSFIHKDFNINNLIYLPSEENHLKCGIIDFQSAFLGESSWDLFSLLEDSRILFSDKNNKYLIKNFYLNSNINFSYDEFLHKYYFLSSARQTRLLGRWIKLANDFNQNAYLEYIPITLHRLKKSISIINNKNLNNFYNKYIFK